MSRHPSGQVLVTAALALVVLLGAASFTVDLGRRGAQERYLQNAADAAALAACNALVDGATDSAALTAARSIATTNLADSPAGADATIAGAGAEEYVAGYSGNPYQLINGAVIAENSVFVAIDSDVSLSVGQILGGASLHALGRARCGTEAEPALPFVIRRYQNPPGPGGSFIDFLATAATSSTGAVDGTDPRGYAGRTPASAAAPGPVFQMYGPHTQATNNSFRGFIALDVRDFTHASSRQYYNGVTPTMSANTLKGHHAAYITNGYPGPAFPPVQNPPTGATQVGIMNGVSAAHSTQAFDTEYDVGDRVMLSVYNGTVMAIPDFAIQPPLELVVPATTASPVSGPTFRASRNSAFSSTVTFELVGDSGADDTGHPEYNILTDPTTTTPAAGQMGRATFSPNGFVPTTGGTNVTISGLRTNAVPEGIYTAWIKGTAGAPYFQTRWQPVPVRVGSVSREFSLDGSVLDGATETLGGTVNLTLRVSTGSGTAAWSGGAGTATPVQLSWDPDSLTDCSFNPRSLGTGSITFSAASVTPTTGVGTASTLTIQAGSLSSGCYMFRLRAQGVNGDGEPVVRIKNVQFTVAATAGPSEYVDIIGFAVFEITDVRSNSFSGRAITGLYADPNDLALRAAQRARLIPWN